MVKLNVYTFEPEPHLPMQRLASKGIVVEIALDVCFWDGISGSRWYLASGAWYTGWSNELIDSMRSVVVKT